MRSQPKPECRVLPFLWLALVALPACSRPAGPPADAPLPFDAVFAQNAVDSLATLIEANFVYPERGRAYAEMLRTRLANGAYASFPDDRAFAHQVTADLQAVYPEGHLRLQPPSETRIPPPDATTAGNGVGAHGWLAPGIAYIRLHGFQGDRRQYDRLVARAEQVLDGFASARTLIVDARPYVGGALDETDAMVSYFFDEPTPLLDIDMREDVERRGGSIFRESARLVRVPGPEGTVRRRQIAQPIAAPTGLKTAKIYVLTSRQTASGGEGFSFVLQRTGRATLIGERTRGAGHMGPTFPLGGGYRAMIPIARPHDPLTDQGWERTGLTPDVQVPAGSALDEALRRAGVDPAAGRRALAALEGPPPPRPPGSR